MLDFCIIGSGVSGSTIAYLLSKRYSVHILDKARGPGGRASNKRFKQNLSFDHGVQYISPKSKEFLKFIKTLCKKKEAKIWTGNHLDFTFEKKLSTTKYIGKVKYDTDNINQTLEEAIEAEDIHIDTWADDDEPHQLTKIKLVETPGDFGVDYGTKEESDIDTSIQLQAENARGK